MIKITQFQNRLSFITNRRFLMMYYCWLVWFDFFPSGKKIKNGFSYLCVALRSNNGKNRSNKSSDSWWNPSGSVWLDFSTFFDAPMTMNSCYFHLFLPFKASEKEKTQLEQEELSFTLHCWRPRSSVDVKYMAHFSEWDQWVTQA